MRYIPTIGLFLSLCFLAGPAHGETSHNGNECKGSLSTALASGIANGWTHEDVPPALVARGTAVYNAMPPVTNNVINRFIISSKDGNIVVVLTDKPDCAITHVGPGPAEKLLPIVFGESGRAS